MAARRPYDLESRQVAMKNSNPSSTNLMTAPNDETIPTKMISRQQQQQQQKHPNEATSASKTMAARERHFLPQRKISDPIGGARGGRGGGRGRFLCFVGRPISMVCLHFFLIALSLSLSLSAIDWHRKIFVVSSFIVQVSLDFCSCSPRLLLYRVLPGFYRIGSFFFALVYRVFFFLPSFPNADGAPSPLTRRNKNVVAVVVVVVVFHDRVTNDADWRPAPANRPTPPANPNQSRRGFRLRWRFFDTTPPIGGSDLDRIVFFRFLFLSFFYLLIETKKEGNFQQRLLHRFSFVSVAFFFKLRSD